MKKVLAWAVVLALVLSSFTMAFAGEAKTSKDFSDASQIQYTEAVDVMVATGVINGYPDGTFGPQKTVKRSEMAKMISVMLEAGEDIGDQYKGACPFADSKDHWAAGYIAYCSAEHIIDGRSADVFDPEAQVTGTEVFKMALTSLGYDSKIQGYTGENWAAAVLKDAKKNNLFDGLKDFVPADPCSREAAAQILFNTLQAKTVKYKSNTSVTVGDDTTVVVSSDVERGDELYKEVFDGALIKQDGTTDEQGNPAHKWFYPDKKTEVGVYPDSADNEFFATENTVDKAIEAYDEDLAKEIKDYTFEYVVNGGEATPDAPAIVKGDTVRLFLTDPVEATGDDPAVPGKAKVVIMKYTPARITGVDTDVSDTDAEDGITAYLTFDGEPESANNKMAGYDAATYVEGAVIAVAMNGEEVLDSYVLEEAASGEVTKTFSGPAFTIDGTKYESTGTGSYVAFDGDIKANDGKVYTLYDYNGYVIASVVEEEAASEEVFYGIETAYGTSRPDWSDETPSRQVKIFTTEGKTEIFTINEDVKVEGEPAVVYADYDAEEQSEEADFVGYFYAYTLNEDGEIAKIIGPKEEGWSKAMTSGGTLNGYVVSEDVAAFYYDAEEEAWTVKEYSDLEKAETIPVYYSIQNEDGEYVALIIGALEAPAEPETVFGFVSGHEDYSQGEEEGNFADVTLWIDGKEVTYPTAKGVYDNLNLDAFAADALVKVTLEDDSITAIAEVADFEAAGTPVEEFKGEAAYYNAAKTDSDATTDEDFYTPVAAKTTSSLKFGTTQVDIQNVSKAVVYYFDGKKLEASSLSKIKTANDAAVQIYQVDADSQVWNIVVFVNDYVAPAEEPAEEVTITWDIDTWYLDLTYNGEAVSEQNPLPETAKVGDTISFNAKCVEGEPQYPVVVEVNGEAIVGEAGAYTVAIEGPTSIDIWVDAQ